MVNLEEKLKEIESAYEQNQQHINELTDQQKRLESAHALILELIKEKNEVTKDEEKIVRNVTAQE